MIRSVTRPLKLYIGAGNVAQIDLQFGHRIISEMNDLQNIFSRDTL
ncbi:DEHA2B09878p [Debaryomyces hansenii CBS767]|uniref:DEHA2B09878p n=1 Tax=Debaryomyces hansenii (strain ATCC 36239 / CBS 767 / BCRC 21394 / JCM 1990 / NBRC 0083 / IGC 2968) TaxID=284592 RepID=B5RT06_DEBHA|nr:DEHA2B09878p [Debaryomyces hansenii CBS767]CAR65479.1 DEHA2B09878p [Debaryomyces hansenii CBS767]|eukprot:XP_002770109.1 DEHA2B09878p [Debaryomyces hansenii CBS767]